MSEYMVVLSGTMADWKSHSPDEIQSLLARYNAWTEKLKAENRFKHGCALGEGFGLAGKDGKLTIDGPYAETKEVLTGYWMIEADSLDHAVELSKDHPAWTHGETVHVYEVANHG